MAVNPILIKAAVKVVVTAATDEEMQEKLLIILLILIITFLLILSMFYYILSQPFDWLADIFGGSSDRPFIEQFHAEKGYIVQGELLFNKKFLMPFKGDYEFSSAYGMRKHPVTGEVKKHMGIDLTPVHHTEILSVEDGEIVFAGLDGNYGNSVEIKHTLDTGQAIYSFYAHLSEIHVCVGDEVVAGQKIGLEGGEPGVDEGIGVSTGHHLHFEIRKAQRAGNDVDPYPYLFEK